MASQMVLVVKNSSASARDIKAVSSIPGSGRSPGGRHGNPLQYSCLKNPMDREAWRATVHRVAKSQTRLNQVSTCASVSKANSAFKKAEIVSYVTVWMALECITVSEISRTEKDKHYIFSCVCGVRKIKQMTHRYRKQNISYTEERDGGRVKLMKQIQGYNLPIIR